MTSTDTVVNIFNKSENELMILVEEDHQTQVRTLVCNCPHHRKCGYLTECYCTHDRDCVEMNQIRNILSKDPEAKFVCLYCPRVLKEDNGDGICSYCYYVCRNQCPEISKCRFGDKCMKFHGMYDQRRKCANSKCGNRCSPKFSICFEHRKKMNDRSVPAHTNETRRKRSRS